MPPTMTGAATHPDEVVTLAQKRAFLESGAAWPGERAPDCIETHASLVFMTRDRAWKLKKPVQLSQFDLRTLQSREAACREELRLNRALAGDVYVGITPLVKRPNGALALGGGAGRIVDWLIEMKRLPAALMLDHRLGHGAAPALSEIESLADTLIAFYLTNPPHADAGIRYYHRLQKESTANADHLREMRQHLGPAFRDELVEEGLLRLDDCRTEIMSRSAQGMVVEGHGDLRAEHVCLMQPPVVFDRIEFDPDFLLVDPFDEFNALGLECAMSGAGWIRAVMLFRLSQAGIPPPSQQLLTAYGVIRCLTVARLAIDHLRDAQVRDPLKWPTRAKRYLGATTALLENRRL